TISTLHYTSDSHEYGCSPHVLVLHEHIPRETERPSQRVEQHYVPTAQQLEHLLRRIHTRPRTTTAALLHRQRILHNRTHSLLHLLRSDQEIRSANSHTKIGRVANVSTIEIVLEKAAQQPRF